MGNDDNFYRDYFSLKGEEKGLFAPSLTHEVSWENNYNLFYHCYLVESE